MGKLAKSGVALHENLLVKWRSHAGCGMRLRRGVKVASAAK
jgi:hypothetical protein